MPYIDAYDVVVPSGAADSWDALLAVLRSELGSPPPGPFLAVMRLEPPGRRGDWTAIDIGHALPGFEVRERREPEHLALVGRHRFSQYALVFDLEEIEAGTRLRAQTWAAFPGVLGRAYRAAVIGSRMHRLVVRRLLRRVAERA